MKPLDIKSSFHGVFTVEVIREGDVIQSLTFPNLITNSGLDYLGDGNTAAFGSCRVGTGNTTPTFTDTGLVNQLAVSTIGSYPRGTSVAQASSPYYGSTTTVWNFAIGAVVGNVAEIGIGPATGNLFCRALILDGLGAPTVLTVLVTESLRVTYQLFQYQVETDVIATVTYSGISYDTVLRPAAINQNQSGIIRTDVSADAIAWGGGEKCSFGPSQTLVAITSRGGVEGVSSTTSTLATYTSGNYYRDVTISVSTAQGNVVGGIGHAEINTTRGGWQMSFTPKIPKDNLKTMTIPMRLSWARYTP